MKTIILDLDGTLANCDHRLHHITQKPKNWKAFNSGYLDDTLIKPVFDVIKLIQGNYYIVIMTGREGTEQGRSDTEKWLNTHSVFHRSSNDRSAVIFYHELIMRNPKDYRPDYEMKISALDDLIDMGYNPVIAFDDRPNVINSFRNRGLYVFDCSQDIKE